MNVFHQRVMWISMAALLAANLGWGNLAQAQRNSTTAAQSNSSDGLKITPYTGPPIYLDEPETGPAPTIVRRETIPEKYDDGTVRLEREVAHFSDNHFEADGQYREYHPNGKVFVEGRFERGRQNGEWSFYFDNGQLNRKANFKSGQPDGAWELHRADGTLAGNRSFRNGLRHGEWITYDPTGKIPIREEHYDDGLADGVWKTWFLDGKQKQQLSFKLGRQDGTSTEWNEKGDKTAEVTHVDGKLEGTAMQWLADGTKIVHEYKAGRLVKQSKQ